MSTLLDIRTKVIGIVSDDSGKLVIPSTTTWVKNTAYTVGQRVQPVTPNGHLYKCKVGGTSHATTEPTWPTTPGATVVDNTVTWEEEPDDFNRNLNSAINTFSRHKPNTKVVDIIGTGAHDYSLPPGWIDDFTIIKSIEYPIDNVPADYLDEEEYLIYQGTSAKKIRLVTYSPSASEKFRVAFTILRTDTTIPDNDVDALCNLAASLCLEELANSFTQTSDSTIAADSVNWRTKGYEFAQRAKAMMKLYKEHMGIKEDDITPAASAVKDLDMKYPGGSERLTHPRWRREKR